MQSQEARAGITVRVKEGHWKSKFNGMRGTVEHKWGHPDHPALDVRLDDGRLELFWFHELERPDARFATLFLPHYEGS